MWNFKVIENMDIFYKFVSDIMTDLALYNVMFQILYDIISILSFCLSTFKCISLIFNDKAL